MAFETLRWIWRIVTNITWHWISRTRSAITKLQAMRLRWRADSHVDEFRRSGETRHLTDAIVFHQEALSLCPQGHPDRSMTLNDLAFCLATRFDQLGTTADLDEAITLNLEALEFCPPGHSDRLRCLNNLGSNLRCRYEQLGADADLHDAITLHGEALSCCPAGDPLHSVLLNNMALCLLIRYNLRSSIVDLEEAIVLNKEALRVCPEGHPRRATCLSNLAASHAIRYEHFEAAVDLDEGIVLHREALSLCPQGDHRRSDCLNNLATCLWTRYSHLSTTADLAEVIPLFREALELHPGGHPDRLLSLSNLASALKSRYEQSGAGVDLDETIVLNREALSLCPRRHLHRSTCLNNLATCLLTRYDQRGVMSDLAEAIDLHREALELRPRDHADRTWSLTNLATCLSTRYRQLGASMDLDEAIVFHREAMQLSPQGHANRSFLLNNLASCLSTRYEQFGAVADLDEAILLYGNALSLCLPGHPNRSMCLSNQSQCLSTRYHHLGTVVDLEEAIILAREALELYPQAHPDRSFSLNNLASYLSNRYERSGARVDLDEAIALNQETLGLCPRRNPLRPGCLSNLASCLLARYDLLGAVADLDVAIDHHREALELSPQGHTGRSVSLSGLAACLFNRYQDGGESTDLDASIMFSIEALELHVPGHHMWSLLLNNLLNVVHTRYRHLGRAKDKEALFDLCSRLGDIPQTVSSPDLSAARKWIDIAETYEHSSTISAYTTALQLLVRHLYHLPLLPQHLEVLKKATSSLAVDAFSACVRNNAPLHAVELLEQGRAVFWSQLGRLRSPLDDVIASGLTGRTLAGEFSQLTSRIRHALRSSEADQHGPVFHLNIELQRVLTRIRELPGLSHFLLPSSFSELQRAASGGPVIIVNASKYGCDALIIFMDQDPIHIPLRITQQGVQDLSTELGTLTVRSRRGDMAREFAIFLRKLWDQIVSPIVDILQLNLPSPSRIWWCPTAEFSLLPLHAANPYRKGQPGLSSLYVSSYTPTLDALIRARRPASPNTVDHGPLFQAIGQANAAGETELFSVASELNHIGQTLDGVATYMQLQGPDACISSVAEALERSPWVHLACHGIPSRETPFKSAFALHDGHFTIERIIQCEPDDPQFVYLSACHTTVGDKESPDEAIHLAAAMQFAGFRSVIGTMWAVDDGHTTQISSTFYKYMLDGAGRLDYTRAAYALHRTMASVNVPLDQRILYIHLGA